jgi:peptidoglycan L-alanyl-D-glutamate endopeptidase CwlK
MTFSLGLKSKWNLQGVHEDLVEVVSRAIQLSTIDFTVLEGVRSIERQRALCECGASQTMKSRHLTGHAVDLGALIDGQVRWDWPLYHKIAEAMKTAALELHIPIEWGGDWKTFPDGPHFQLTHAQYPAPFPGPI